MNFLAHLYLSGDDRNIKIGNFIADSIKGKSYIKYPEKIQTGILLHREIDNFTDTHPIVSESKSRFRDLYGLHSGIIIDIIYDHYLSINWELYSNENKSEFIKEAYILLLTKYSLLPGNVRMFLPFMVVNNWLAKYEFTSGIKQVITGMSMRTSLPDKTELAMKIFSSEYEKLNSDFKQFFPELIEFVQYKKTDLLKNL